MVFISTSSWLISAYKSLDLRAGYLLGTAGCRSMAKFLCHIHHSVFFCHCSRKDVHCFSLVISSCFSFFTYNQGRLRSGRMLKQILRCTDQPTLLQGVLAAPGRSRQPVSCACKSCDSTSWQMPQLTFQSIRLLTYSISFIWTPSLLTALQARDLYHEFDRTPAFKVLLSCLVCFQHRFFSKRIKINKELSRVEILNSVKSFALQNTRPLSEWHPKMLAEYTSYLMKTYI